MTVANQTAVMHLFQEREGRRGGGGGENILEASGLEESEEEITADTLWGLVNPGWFFQTCLQLWEFWSSPQRCQWIPSEAGP